MVRDPLSWLQSLKKAPYDLKRCTKKEDWLTAPCATPKTFTDWIAHPDPLASIPPPKFLYVPFPGRPALPNLESFWNEWTRDYTHMADFGFADSLVIRCPPHPARFLISKVPNRAARTGHLVERGCPVWHTLVTSGTRIS